MSLMEAEAGRGNCDFDAVRIFFLRSTIFFSSPRCHTGVNLVCVIKPFQVGELREMRRSIDEREQTIGEKNDEIRKLKAEGAGMGGGEEMKAVQLENESLKLTLDKVQSQLDTSLDAQEQQRKVLEAINRQFGDHLHHLGQLQNELTQVLNT